MKIKKAIQYLKSLVKAGTLDSSKSFALLLSALTGAAAMLCVCFCIVWDVVSNGRVETDLDSLGVFVLCVGGYVAGGGTAKYLSERKKAKAETPDKQ